MKLRRAQKQSQRWDEGRDKSRLVYLVEYSSLVILFVGQHSRMFCCLTCSKCGNIDRLTVAFIAQSTPPLQLTSSEQWCLEDMREDYQNCSVLNCVGLPVHSHSLSTHVTYEQFLQVYGWFIGLVGVCACFVCFFLLRVSLFLLCFLVYIFSCLFWVVSTIASDCLERRRESKCPTRCKTLLTHSLAQIVRSVSRQELLRLLNLS